MIVKYCDKCGIEVKHERSTYNPKGNRIDVCDNCHREIKFLNDVVQFIRDSFIAVAWEHTSDRDAILMAYDGIKEMMSAIFEFSAAHKPEFSMVTEEYGAWICADEQLPEKSGVYIIFQKSEEWSHGVMQTAHYNSSIKKFTGAQAATVMTDVTHWMVLPEEPEKKGGAEK